MTVTLTGVSIGFGGVAFGGVQIYAPNAIPPTPTPTQAPTGGWAPPETRRRTKEDVQREREQLGIVEPAQAVVEKLARRVLAKAKEAVPEGPGLMLRPEQIDPLEWLADHQAQQRRILEADLTRKRIQWSVLYWQALKLEIERQWLQWLQEREDEQILSLLLSM